jgi:polyisoprenoid-binding protein YceI
MALVEIETEIAVERPPNRWRRRAAPAIVAGLFLASLAGGVSAAPSLDPAKASPGHYVLDRRHASLVARVRHMGLSLYTMRFNKVEGDYDFDPAQPLASKISVTIDAKSLDTGDPGVSKQFASEFLDADHNPTITFKSSAIQTTDDTHGTVTGDLTLRGVTQPVTLDVIYDGAASGLIGGHRMGFSATATIKRSLFGSKAWLGDVGDDVQLVIEAEFARQ